MAALDALKEDILDVFQIFDEDGSGSISYQELTRALYTITGTRFPRSDLRALVQSAQEELNEEANLRRAKAQAEQVAPTVDKTADWAADTSAANQEADVVDAALFVIIVLKTLNRRTPEQELSVTFHLLEDKNYPGFITKESLMKAAAEMEERLTEQEVNEMFDKLVTGQPNAAVDFSTFKSILESARKMDD